MLPAAGRVLDAACGTGKYFPTVLASGRSLLGVGHAGALLAVAAAKFPQVATDKHDLQDLPYKGEFDGVLCVDAMEFVPPEDWPVVLERFRRALRPGGWLYLTVELAPGDQVRALNEAARRLGLPVVDGEVIWDEPDGYYHHYPTVKQVRRGSLMPGSPSGGGRGALARGGVRLPPRAGPPGGPSRLRMPVLLALGSAAITPSGAARLQRITWPSTFADHQERQRSAWRSLEDC